MRKDIEKAEKKEKKAQELKAEFESEEPINTTDDLHDSIKDVPEDLKSQILQSQIPNENSYFESNGYLTILCFWNLLQAKRIV